MNKLSVSMAIKLASNLRSDQKERALKALRRLWHMKRYNNGMLLNNDNLIALEAGNVLNFRWNRVSPGWAFWYLIEDALIKEFGIKNITPAINY